MRSGRERMNEPERVVEAEIVQVEDVHSEAAHRVFAARRFAARGFSAARSTETASTKMEVAACLFLATYFSTYLTGGLAFATALMLILLARGHFLQARRYGVRKPPCRPYAA